MNKNGWGLRAELGFLLLFLICLLVATIGLQKMDIFGLGDRRIGSNYTKYEYGYKENEDLLAKSAKKYYDNVYPNGSHDTIIINLDTLINNGYINTLYDKYGKECTGYAKILNGQASVGYIKCGFYKTVGYSEEYE